MEWAVVEQGAKIVNFPFDYIGHIPGASPRPLGELVNRLTESHGVLVAAGVGDFGPLPIINGVGPIGPPCVADAALCVAAVNRADQTAPFSAVAPPLGEQIKPDISAPGVEITAALATDLPYGPFGTPVDENYTTVSSTAMATAHVAGAAALLSERYPNLTGSQLKALLMGSALSTPATPIIEQGTGRVDVAAAFAAAVFAEPGSLPFGTALWPHDDDPGITRDVTFRNISNTATALTFRFEVSGPNGNAAPEGLFSINTTSLTIPANGSASVRVTANMRIGTAYGVFIGKLIASSTNGSSVPIPVSVHREVESYNLKLVNLDSEGQPALFAHQFIRTDAEWPVTSGADSGELKVRLPKGRYNIDSAIFSSGPPALMMYPALFHDADRTLTFDAREAQALEPIAPTATASLLNAQFRYVVATDFGAEHESLFLEYPPRTPPFLVATFGESAKGLRSDLNLQWTDPAAASGSKQESDSVYSGAWVTQGRLISGGARALPRDKLAVVRAAFASAFPEVTAATATIAVVNSNGSRGFSIPLPIALPSKRTEYYYSENDIRWKSIVMLEANENLMLESADNRYLAGHSYSQRWNEPPFSPAFPEKNVRERYVRRSGDILWVDLPLYGDRGGHGGSIGEYAIKLCLAEECVECIAPNCGGFRVPPELATYRLEGLETQSAYPLSTEVHGAWMFDSAYVSTGEQVKPLLSISIRPALNESGKARRGTLRIPLSVHEVGNPGTADVSEVTVQASFDDGASWQKMPVSRVGKEWVVEMSHPQKGDYVSLRMSAQGTGNNRVEEMIVRAYGLMDATSR
jgi:hypothetical protein